MRVDTNPTMRWEDAPDTITPKDLSKILGIGVESARKIFRDKDFPNLSEKIIGNIGKADKDVARLYIQGIKIKNSSKDDILKLIYMELKNINLKLNSIQLLFNKKEEEK